jgi:hypothetical protein
MSYKFNPFTGTLDYYDSSSGGVTGVPPTDINAITRWADTGGTMIKNSPHTLVQDSGAIEAQAFIFEREIANDVTVPDGYTMISTDVSLTTGDLILDGDGTLLLL